MAFKPYTFSGLPCRYILCKTQKYLRHWSQISGHKMELKTLVSNFSQYSELISLKLEQRLNIKNQDCKPEALAFNNLNTLRK